MVSDVEGLVQQEQIAAWVKMVELLEQGEEPALEQGMQPVISLELEKVVEKVDEVTSLEVGKVVEEVDEEVN